MLLYRISFILACLVFVKMAVSQDPNVEGTYSDWIKEQMKGHTALSETLGKLTEKMGDHIETSRGKIAEAVATLQKVMKSNEYSKCSKNVLQWIKNLDGHDFAPCYNKQIYNKTASQLKQLQAIRKEIPAECRSKSAMADSKVMSNCVNETGNVVMKHMKDFEGSLQEFSDAMKETSGNCVTALKKKMDTFVDYVNAGCPDGAVDSKKKRK